MKFTTVPSIINHPTLKDVDSNQFFIDLDGYICQKETPLSYFTLADDKGNPSCYHITVYKEDEPIKKILPKVLKIEV